jgi:hypothetical protein
MKRLALRTQGRNRNNRQHLKAIKRVADAAMFEAGMCRILQIVRGQVGESVQTWTNFALDAQAIRLFQAK